MFTSPYHRIALTFLFLLFMVIAPISSQDAETTEDPTLTQVTVTDLPTATPIPSPVVEPTLTFTPSPTQIPQPTATLIPTITATMQTVSATVPANISSTHTAIPTLTPIIETTEDLLPISATATEASPYTPTPTVPTPISATETPIILPLTPISATDTPTPQTPTSSTIVSISPTLASVSATYTPTIMPSISPTQIMATITPTVQATATIGGLPLRYIQGIVVYQNHVTDDSGILLQVYTEDLTLVSEITTNEEGIYNIAVPIDDVFWIVFSAEWHRTERIYVTEAEGLADLTLVAGDLNGDECINFDDFHLMQNQFNSSGSLYDLNDDTQTDLSDIAMLAGNLNPSCVVEVEEATSTPNATLTPMIQVTVTNIFTPTLMTAISSTATESPTIEAETTEDP